MKRKNGCDGSAELALPTLTKDYVKFQLLTFQQHLPPAQIQRKPKRQSTSLKEPQWSPKELKKLAKESGELETTRTNLRRSIDEHQERKNHKFKYNFILAVILRRFP